MKVGRGDNMHAGHLGEPQQSQRRQNSFRAGEGAAPGCKAAGGLCAGKDHACQGAGADWLSGGRIADYQPATSADIVVAGRAGRSAG